MGFAAGVFLLTAGAILTFALRVDLWWIDVHTAGLVLMLAGIVVLMVAAFSRRERRRAPYGEPPGMRMPPPDTYRALISERTYDPPAAGPRRMELPPPVELPEERPPESPPQD
jgi:hypothetical protein